MSVKTWIPWCHSQIVAKNILYFMSKKSYNTDFLLSGKVTVENVFETQSVTLLKMGLFKWNHSF